MLSVILTILKIIGIVLAVLVGLILLIVLLVGFVPIRYKAKAKFPYEGEMDEEVVSRRKRENLKKKVNSGKEIVYTEEESEFSVKIKADAVVSWLLHIVHVTFAMDNTASVLTVRLFGIFKIYSNDPKTVKKKEEKKKKKEEKKRRKEEKDKEKDKKKDSGKKPAEEESKITDNKDEIKESGKEKEKEKETDSLKDKDEKEPETSRDKKSEKQEVKEDKEEPDGIEEDDDDDIKDDEDNEEESSDEKKGITGKLKNLYNKFTGIKKKIDYLLETKNDTRVRKGVSYAKKKLFLIIKRILPKKLKGRVAFGMDDPATTGYITGGLSLFYGLWGEHFILEPDFENKKLEADVDLKGKITLGMLAIPAAKVWFNKDIKYIRKKVDGFKKL